MASSTLMSSGTRSDQEMGTGTYGFAPATDLHLRIHLPAVPALPFQLLPPRHVLPRAQFTLLSRALYHVSHLGRRGSPARRSCQEGIDALEVVLVEARDEVRGEDVDERGSRLWVVRRQGREVLPGMRNAGLRFWVFVV